MIRFRRRNTGWLIALGILVAFALAVANIPPLMQAALIGILVASIAASVIQISPRRSDLVTTLQRAPLRRRISPQAKEAAERAKSRGGYNRSNLVMLDVGLIALQSGGDGITMRRARSISKDDDGARPFVTLHVPPDEAERYALIRYEIIDHNGQEKFVYETKTWLRDGEMNILADHHLPLVDNDAIVGIGDWDLRVTIDGDLFALHNFTLAPSIIERRERLARRTQPEEQPRSAPLRNVVVEPVDVVDESGPPTLEQLLKKQNTQQEAPAGPASRRSVRATRPRRSQ